MNLSRDQYIDLLKQSFVTLGVDGLFKYLVAQIPFLGWVLVAPQVKIILRFFIGKMLEHGETAAFFQFIDIRVNGQHVDFEKAAIENSLAQINGTPEEKLRAEEKLKDAFRTFVRLAS